MEEIKQDPDYESYNSSVKSHKEEDKKENAAKLRQILEEEYNKELVMRQEQIIKIEMQICKFRKLLSLLRYVLVTSYYKRPELEYTESDDVSLTSDSICTLDKQNRIHPAIKKLLGKNIQNLDHLTVTDKRKSHTKKYIESPPNKKPKLSKEPQPTNLVSNTVTIEDVRNRKKTKHRLVIGNISKWMPSSENDALTHKWMMYVRGPKEQPDVSHIIDKVVFYLHPSYKPHDVVSVCESPFHLCRRGWGEFPVRVKIHFKIPINKPIDIIHNIKLDLKYTGRQTLGNETVLDVFLYDGKNVENICEIEEQIHLGDHLYCRPLSEENLPKSKPDKVEQDESNHLIWGLDKSYIDTSSKSIKATNSPQMNTTLIPINALKQFLQQNRKDGKFNNAKIIVVTNVNKLNTIDPNYKVTVPQNRFKNMGEALPYVFRKLPLYTELAGNLNYKKVYPFTATNLKEYSSWNIGKRRSSEWSRAKAVLKILKFAQIFGVEKWNTKSILMYGRSHHYTPDSPYGLFSRESIEKTLLLSCFRDSMATEANSSFSSDINVDVDSDGVDLKKTNSKPMADISDANLVQECAFIRETALDSGVMLKHEELEEGIRFNGAERMIFEALKCLAESLIRRADNYKICTNSDPYAIVNKDDVEAAIKDRPELIAIWKFKNKRRDIEYYS